MPPPGQEVANLTALVYLILELIRQKFREIRSEALIHILSHVGYQVFSPLFIVGL